MLSQAPRDSPDELVRSGEEGRVQSFRDKGQNQAEMKVNCQSKIKVSLEFVPSESCERRICSMPSF